MLCSQRSSAGLLNTVFIAFVVSYILYALPTRGVFLSVGQVGCINAFWGVQCRFSDEPIIPLQRFALRWLGDREGIQPVKSWVLVCWWWQFDCSFAHLIPPFVTIISMLQCTLST